MGCLPRSLCQNREQNTEDHHFYTVQKEKRAPKLRYREAFFVELMHLLAVDAARGPPLSLALLDLAAKLEGGWHQQQVLHHVQNLKKLFAHRQGRWSRVVSRRKLVDVVGEDSAR